MDMTCDACKNSGAVQRDDGCFCENCHRQFEKWGFPECYFCRETDQGTKKVSFRLCSPEVEDLLGEQYVSGCWLHMEEPHTCLREAFVCNVCLEMLEPEA